MLNLSLESRHAFSFVMFTHYIDVRIKSNQIIIIIWWMNYELFSTSYTKRVIQKCNFHFHLLCKYNNFCFICLFRLFISFSNMKHLYLKREYITWWWWWRKLIRYNQMQDEWMVLFLVCDDKWIVLLNKIAIWSLFI